VDSELAQGQCQGHRGDSESLPGMMATGSGPTSTIVEDRASLDRTTVLSWLTRTRRVECCDKDAVVGDEIGRREAPARELPG
jgi:hypothetical protein